MSNRKHVLVQGGGRGLGLALVERLVADETCCITATARDPDHSQRLGELITEYGEQRIVSMAVDVTNKDSIARARDAIGKRHPRLDLMILCAGLLHEDDTNLHPEKKLGDIDTDNFARSFAVNATGPALMIKHFHDLLTHGERAVIASISARVGSISDNNLGGWYAYRASKAAQNQITRTAAIELRRKSRLLICVGLHPGTVDTALSLPFQGRVPEKQLQTPAEAAGHLLSVIDKLSADDSGKLFDWAGELIAP